MPAPRFVPLGEHQEVTGHRQEQAERKLDAAREYAIKSNTHMWGVYVMHHATDQLLDVYDGRSGDALPMLDADTLLMRPVLGCFVCEEPYTPRDRRRRCPGEPR